ncbi:hypothetical protein SOM70_37630 [Streptomyces salinarius]|uniref:hypothetical protein n=1 Tax=Streptomyces salinarius TaxID=2762598 RepID=UPI0032DF8AB6
MVIFMRSDATLSPGPRTVVPLTTRVLHSRWEVAGEAATAVLGVARSGVAAGLAVVVLALFVVAPDALAVVAGLLGAGTVAVPEGAKGFGFPTRCVAGAGSIFPELARRPSPAPEARDG